MNPLSSKVHFLAQTRQKKVERTEQVEQKINTNERIRRQSLAHAQTLFSSVIPDIASIDSRKKLDTGVSFSKQSDSIMTLYISERPPMKKSQGFGVK